MSNLVKSFNVICNDSQVKIIDNNAYIFEKVSKLNQIRSIRAEESAVAEGEFCAGLAADVIETTAQEDTQFHAAQIIEDAKRQAQEILDQAIQEAQQLKNDAFQNGKKEAYDLVMQEASKEIDGIKQELFTKQQQMETEYMQRLEEMEPELVDVILEVFGRVTHVLAEDKRDMMLYLVNSVMTKAEISRNFIIKVSKEDYKFLLDNREQIHGALMKDINIEIVQDASMKRNECIIETDGGIYDCSLDIQLENLIKDIKVLACMTE